MSRRLGKELRRFQREFLAAIGVAVVGCGAGKEDEPAYAEPPWCGLPAPADPRMSPLECEGDVAPPPQGVDDGWDRCNNMIHRRSQLECPLPTPFVGDCDPDLFGAPECYADEDCGEGGVCDRVADRETCGCVYPCRTDSDCVDGQVCFCSEDGTRPFCVDAHCTTDDDCEPGYACRYREFVGLACDTPFDECRSSDDCPDDQCRVCSYEPAACGAVCASGLATCTIGRPFLVAGEERRAVVEATSTWSTPIDGEQTVPTSEEGSLLAQHWTAAGLMEHASVAAFARFALQLVAVGAPPGLLADTAAAMADEVEHARACFGLARSYGAQAVGPGPLETSDAMNGPQDLATVAELAVVEACIGETLAAAEAVEALRVAREPQVRCVLSKIAEDELRHATLGWRFVDWALHRLDPRGRERVEHALVVGIGRASRHVSTRRGIPAHGLLGGAAQASLYRRVAFETLEPTAAALLGKIRRSTAMFERAAPNRPGSGSCSR